MHGKVSAEAATCKMLQRSGPEMKTHQTVKSISKITIHLHLKLLRIDMHWITYQLTYKLVPEDQLCYSTFPTASNHIHFKDKKSCKGNSTANLQVISPAGRMKNWVQFTLSQMPQHCSADSGKNTIVSEKQMPRTTLTPELLVAWCHVYIYNPGRECKTVWIQIIEEIGVKAGFTRQKKKKKSRTFDLWPKKVSSSFVQGVSAQPKMPRSTQESSQRVLSHRCTEYACPVGSLGWQNSS